MSDDHPIETTETEPVGAGRVASDPVVRPADEHDIGELVHLYRRLELEMTALHPMWRIADGLPEPVEEAFAHAVADPETIVAVGTFDEVPFGFILAYERDLLPQAGGERVGVIKLVYVEEEARGVGIGEALRDHALDRLRARGLHLFDAYVLPGHRMAKNFFEAGGFSARSIIMHHDDHRER